MTIATAIPKILNKIGRSKDPFTDHTSKDDALSDIVTRAKNWDFVVSAEAKFKGISQK
jgi:hypothetical protein